MRRLRLVVTGASCFAAAMAATGADAQPLGSFRWQLQPFCNVVTVAITQNGSVYRLEGTDDQCGNGADAASVTGTAFPNSDGTIGIGLNIVTTPGGAPVHVDAEISVATFSGTWRDSARASGAFVFTPGAGSGGSPRPLPSPGIPTTIQLRTDGGFVAGGALTANGGPATIPASGPGVRMMWYPGKAAFRVGEAVGSEWNDANVGLRSASLGFATTASGTNSTALGQATRATGANSMATGFLTTASGSESTAIGLNNTASGGVSTTLGQSTTASGLRSLATGFNTTASGDTSVAMGSGTTASGVVSMALGINTIASGVRSTAMGFQTTASGTNSTAMGNASAASGDNSLAAGLASSAGGLNAMALGQSTSAAGDSSVALGFNAVATAAADGSFVFADRSPGSPFTSFIANQFLAKATGGVGFYTNNPATTGVELAPAGSSWASLSDVNAKENFRDVDGEDVLAKLAAMSIQEWNYKAQDAAIRHMGPTAQAFRAAFGLGDFTLRINTIDADGVALAAVKALDARTRATNERLQRENDELRARLARLERLISR